MSTQIKQPLRKPKAPVKKVPAISPLSQMIGKWFTSEHLSGSVMCEPAPGLLEVALLLRSGEDEGVRSFLSLDNIEGVVFFPTKESWLDAVNCECEDCSDECDQDCDENAECFCPECLTERVEIRKNVARLEDEQSKEAIEGIVKETLKVTEVSEAIRTACAELEAGRRNGYQK